MAICADEWKGRFREYDIVNKIWPVVNQDLYKCLNCEGLISERTNRCKMIYDMDEIIEIANLDPVLVHPVYGISSRGNRRFEDGESQVGEFYKNQRKYKLNEMTGYGRLTSEKKVSYPMDNITDFLYLIGSVFAPMIAIQIADFFLLKQDKSSRAVYVPNMIIWVIGFVVYRILMNVDMPVGNTLPDMVITIILCLIAGKLIPEKNQKK